ncbi:uncharacterized protein LOC122957648 isoform X2 [Acropora millepora]|uniref:uncharacterized protein LOC122957648 isoform X2 n=1 Tax=Acropora millepora TaxID=45264 RepID=UPI001CF4DE94|nr:uncharacterized protein LOC122957648 isoform X2 [Acropora millepora]
MLKLIRSLLRRNRRSSTTEVAEKEPKQTEKRKNKKGNNSRESKYREKEDTIHKGNMILTKSSSNTNNSFGHSNSPRRDKSSPKMKTTLTEDFWDRNFAGQISVLWKPFRAAFLEDYGSLIQEFAPKRINWILTIIHNDIFCGEDAIHKRYYDKFCGKANQHLDRFWLKVTEYASERIFREGVIESMFE